MFFRFLKHQGVLLSGASLALSNEWGESGSWKLEVRSSRNEEKKEGCE
jgi:hypothetical protein